MNGLYYSSINKTTKMETNQNNNNYYDKREKIDNIKDEMADFGFSDEMNDFYQETSNHNTDIIKCLSQIYSDFVKYRDMGLEYFVSDLRNFSQLARQYSMKYVAKNFNIVYHTQKDHLIYEIARDYRKWHVLEEEFCDYVVGDKLIDLQKECADVISIDSDFNDHLYVFKEFCTNADISNVYKKNRNRWIVLVPLSKGMIQFLEKNKYHFYDMVGAESLNYLKNKD